MKIIKSISNIYFLLIFINLFIYVYSDNCNSTYCISDGLTCKHAINQYCSPNCRPKYGDYSRCYDCGSSINYYQINNNICNLNCTNNYIISMNKECVSIQPLNLFKMGNYLYEKCPIYSRLISNNECKCENKYYITKDNNNKILYNCLSPTSICPNNYKYYNNKTGECYNNNFKTSIYIKKIETNKNIRNLQTLQPCSSTQFIDDSGYCINTCIRFIYIDSIHNKKYCLNNCNFDNHRYRIKNDYCVPKEQCDFYEEYSNSISINYSGKCLSSCDESTYRYHIVGTKECIDSCPSTGTNIYIDLKNHICYPQTSCNFIQKYNNKYYCLSTCNIGEGYKVLDTPNQCYKECIDYKNSLSQSIKPFYNQGTNICIESCQVSGNDKIYHELNNYECYYSCKDIKSGTLMYVDNNNICYSSLPCTGGDDYYYTLSDGVKKCALQSNCISNNYIYLIGKECMKECNYYKMLNYPPPTTLSTLIKCTFDFNDCFTNGYYYYNTNEKFCWNTLPNGYCIKSSSTTNKYEILPISENYYYYESGSSIKYCTSSCKENGKYIDYNDKKKCISSCSDIGTYEYYFYDPRNNQCLETCIGSGLEFAELTGTINKCLGDNDNKCYFENKKILVNCDDSNVCPFFKSIGSKICVTNCQENQKSNNYRQCVNICPEDSPYINDNNECKQLSECSYVNEERDRCLTRCSITEGFHIDSTTNGQICYKSCPSNSNIQYHDYNNNICFQSCQSPHYQYHKDGEYICYPSCNIIPSGKYLYLKDNICFDIMPDGCNFYIVIDNNIKECKSDCTGFNYYKGKECTNTCLGYKVNYIEGRTPIECLEDDLNECFNGIIKYNYYNKNDKYCWDDYPTGYYIIKSEDSKYEVINSCDTTRSLKYEYIDEEKNKKKCISFELCQIMGKYKKGTECVSSCNIGEYIDNSICVSSCNINNSGNKFYNYGSNICISSCKGEFLYHIKDDYVCYESCNDIQTTSNPYKYLRGNICSQVPCIFHRKLINNVEKCYDSEQDCINDGFEYLKYSNNERECIFESECNEFKVRSIRDSNGKIESLGKCFESTADCKLNGYLYYNIGDKECWYTCPYYMIELDNNGFPNSDSDGNTCVKACPTNYPKLSDNYCTPNCPNFVDEDGNCLSDCGDKFITSGNICTNACNNNRYFINNSGKKECLSSGQTCESIFKFYFSDNPNKCVDSCDNEIKKYYFYNSGGECIESCLQNTDGNLYADEPISGYKKCKTGCDSKYYYEDEKICREKINCILFKKTDPNICMIECENNQKVDGDKCVDNCPTPNPYFVEEKIIIRGKERIIKRCIKKDCKSYSSEYSIIYASSNGLECLKTCYEGYYKINGFCYKKCENTNKYLDISDYECKNLCSTNFYEELSGYPGIYICKENCDGKYKLKDDNDKYKCLIECPSDHNYINSDNECKTSCDGIWSIIKDIKEEYIIYKCINSCPIEEYYYSENDKKCYPICNGNDIINAFSYYKNNIRKCWSSCDISDGVDIYRYYGEDKKCMKKCNFYIEELTNRCIEKCDNEQYKFKYENGDLKQCLKECPEGYERYVSPDYKCLEECPIQKRNFPLTGYECIEKCEENQYKEIIYKTDGSETGEYRCVSDYGEKFYYKNDKILIGKCKEGHYIVIDTHECVEDCEKISTNIKKYYHYDPIDNTEPENDMKKCVLTCPEQKKFYYDNHCIDECSGERPVYKEGDKICLEKCPENFYKKENENICVNSCKDNDLFLSKGKCVEYCPDGENENKFYIASVNECIPDCNYEKRFYIEISNNETPPKIKYECCGICPNKYYLVNEDPSLNATLCLPNEATCSNKNYYSDENDENKCYKNCPNEKKYVYVYETTKKCYNKCPDYTYHEKDKNNCIDPTECTSKIADFESKTCVSDCKNEEIKYIHKIKDNTNLVVATICLKSCNNIYGEYITPDNECVNNCQEFDENSEIDETHSKCKCKNLYYYDKDLKKTICLGIDIKHCYENPDTHNLYKIQIFGTRECVKECEYISSLNGELCYKNASVACGNNDIDTNSVLKIIEDKQKCMCPFKFYKDSNNKINCLGELAICASYNFRYYIPETMECVNACTGTYFKKFKIFCLKVCPLDSTDSEDNNCVCNNYWYENSGTYICLPENHLCKDKYKAFAPETKQCLEKCKGSYYPYLFQDSHDYKNKCYTGCHAVDGTDNLISIETNDELAIFSCVCKRPWFYEKNAISEEYNIHCPDESILYCSQYNDDNLIFKIHETNECVQKCPKDYPFYFNHECFTDCENYAALEYNYAKKKGTAMECECENLWYYTNVERTIKNCINPNTISCLSYESDNLIPVKYPYLVLDTNECIEKCQDNLFTFNYTCYNKCPENTILLSTPESDTLNTCTCNKEIDAYWYKYILYDKTFYICGVKKCPENFEDKIHNRPNLVPETKECLEKCSEDATYQFELRKICLKKCPTYTLQDNDKFLCNFVNLNDETYVKEKESLKNYANVQAKELYETAVTYGDSHSGGCIFNKFDDVSLQIYAIDKDNSLKEISTKSNLTYVDLDTCIPKIYSDNNLSNNDKIIVSKYDLKYWNIEGATNSENSKNYKFLINRVEYEFYNSKTMEKIDASICDPYEILISYPIFFNKLRYNDYNSGFNENEYKNKFEIGKKLYEKNNNLDTFNSNDTLYRDLCIGIEIDGKDLVLEDRIEYLYPNNALLCESNCTYNNTDFIEERVNCKCAYKSIIDFDRVEKEKNDLMNDPNYYKAQQSPANFEVMKCLSKLNAKEGIGKNIAFYYGIAIITVEAITALVSGFYGMKVVSNNITKILNRVGNINNNNNNLDNIFRYRRNKNQENINTSKRVINIPPKRFNSNNNIIISEFIPPEYNFKFFKLRDKGVIKKFERSKIPFEINPNTKYLLERRKGVDYPEDYLEGPFFNDQNIVQIVDNIDEINSNTNTNNDKFTNNGNPNNENNYISSNENIINTKRYKNGSEDEDLKEEEIISEKKELSKIKTNKNNINQNNRINKGKDKDFITIRKIKGQNTNYSNNDKNNKITIEEYIEQNRSKKNTEDNSGLLTLIKKEQLYLRIEYEKYIKKQHPNLFIIFLTEILDKVYLVNICLFLKKFEFFAIHFAIYLFCHLLLITLLCAFFTINVIKKIWRQENYPGIGFYLLYGFISYIVIWVIYKVFLCLLDIQDKVKQLVRLKNDMVENDKKTDNLSFENNNNNSSNNEDNADYDIIGDKYDEIMSSLKLRIIVIFAIIFAVTLVCFFYLITFFGIYTATKWKVLEAYLVTIIEVLVIKFIYGIILAAIRVTSNGNRVKMLYSVAYVFDKYLS